MKTRAELKSMAKGQIRGNIGILFVISLIVSVISGLASLVLNFIPGGGLLVSIIITPAFTISVLRVYLNLAKGQKPAAADAFSGFNDFWSACVYIFIW